MAVILRWELRAVSDCEVCVCSCYSLEIRKGLEGIWHIFMVGWEVVLVEPKIVRLLCSVVGAETSGG